MASFFEIKYSSTYYYANIVSNILTQDIELNGFISNFFANDGIIWDLAKPFEKRSAFHKFIEFMISEFFENDMDDHDQRIFKYYQVGKHPIEPLYSESALREYDLLGDGLFANYLSGKDTIEYIDIEKFNDGLRLTGSLELLYEKIANEVFYIMFNNREVLRKFNFIVAENMEVDFEEIEEEDEFDEIRKLFKTTTSLNRQRIPEWAKRAVYFRDRGRCCLCTLDLSGTLSLNSKKHFDHIVPLKNGGLNDISNLQLLCSNCNLTKSSQRIATSSLYESWYN
jgi:HNH endonuclease